MLKLTVRAGFVAVMVLFATTGCAASAPKPSVTVGVEGAVTVILGGWKEIAKSCTSILAKTFKDGAALGCTTWLPPSNAVFIMCPVDHPAIGLAQCLAHEMCHAREGPSAEGGEKKCGD